MKITMSKLDHPSCSGGQVPAAVQVLEPAVEKSRSGR